MDYNNIQIYYFNLYSSIMAMGLVLGKIYIIYIYIYALYYIIYIYVFKI